jgi:hypothetical protein
VSPAQLIRTTRTWTDDEGSRYEQYLAWVDTINTSEKGFDSFSKGYLEFGFQVKANGNVHYREWAPGAETASLIGDFSAFPPFGWGDLELI